MTGRWLRRFSEPGEPLTEIACLMNALLPLVFAAILGGGGPDWKAFTPKGTTFSVTVPGQPTETQQTIKAAQGTIGVRIFSLTTKEGTYVAGLTEHPEAAVPKGQDQARLDQARDGAVQEAKGRLRWEKKIVVDGKSGREFFVATETGHAVKIRLIADGPRLYQVMVVGNIRFLDSAEAARFIESFRLTK